MSLEEEIMTNKIAFITCGIGPLMIKKDPFCIPYELARLGFNVVIITSYDSIHVPGCRMIKTIVLSYRMFKIMNTLSILSKILPTYVIDLLPTVASFYDAIKALHIILSDGVNTVITYYYPLYILLLGLFKRAGRYKIVCKMDWDGVIRGSRLKRMLRKLGLVMTWKYCDAVIVESYEALSNIAKEFPGLVSKVHVVYNGWCDKLMHCANNSNRKKQIICVARITPVKGIHDLIMAFYIASKRVPGWRLIIAGPIVDKQYYGYLQNLIKKFNLENSISFMGMVSDEELARIYAGSSIFVLPSYHESFGIARVEALACGLPVITTETGGSEVVRGVGLVVKPGDVYGLAKALEELMSNGELRTKLSKLALNRAKVLTWRSIAEILAKIVESL